MNLTTKDLSEILEEVEPFTLVHCEAILAAARKVRDIGPLPPEPPLSACVIADPFMFGAFLDARAKKRHIAECEHRDLQETAFNDVTMPLNWLFQTFSDGTVMIYHSWLRQTYPIDPDARATALLAYLNCCVNKNIAEAAADWRAQAADLLNRAELADNFAVVLFAK